MRFGNIGAQFIMFLTLALHPFLGGCKPTALGVRNVMNYAPHPFRNIDYNAFWYCKIFLQILFYFTFRNSLIINNYTLAFQNLLFRIAKA
ncbi:hypothetical protein CTI18_10710 [Prevotella intermedia]|uniref:Uncharacterized protein n=1 Tax=Prevotella intermedia TaxID=28131 RepID=A0A2G8I7D0_PREIN|nr:hypothetical protein CTI18_10710 [Prevotella intermedia]